MTTADATASPDPAGIALVRLGARALTGGIAGLAVWEAFARLAAPAWIGFALDPAGLVEMAFGFGGVAADALHVATGLVLFPAGYVLVFRPLAARLAPGAGWVPFGAAYGVALWVFAMYGVASLLGGAPPFLGFAPVAWASLAGHVGLGLGIAGGVDFGPGSPR